MGRGVDEMREDDVGGERRDGEDSEGKDSGESV
jgi:hypothetical protein